MIESEKLTKQIDIIKKSIVFLSDLEYSHKTRKDFILKKFFRTIANLYDKVDLGSLYNFTIDDRVVFIDSIGHNLKYLKSTELHMLDFEFTNKEVRIIKDITSETKDLFEKLNKNSEKNEYDKNIINVHETILFPLQHNDRIISEFAFEISKESENNFTETDLETFKLLHRLFQDKFDDFMYKKKINIKRRIIENDYKEELRIDHLTGVYNKKYFDEIFNREYSRALRFKRNLSLVMIDIDYFKKYNDNFGHVQGDLALKKISTAIDNQLNRSTDYFFRYGGEEFVALITDTDFDNSFKISKKIKKAVEDLNIPNFLENGRETKLTISLGIHSSRVNSFNKKEFLNLADKALYQAKKNGRNKIGYYIYEEDNNEIECEKTI